jgi:hypothetical protein
MQDDECAGGKGEGGKEEEEAAEMRLEAFRWSTDNSYFQLSNMRDGLAMGGGGAFALLVDPELLNVCVYVCMCGEGGWVGMVGASGLWWCGDGIGMACVVWGCGLWTGGEGLGCVGVWMCGMVSDGMGVALGWYVWYGDVVCRRVEMGWAVSCVTHTHGCEERRCNVGST